MKRLLCIISSLNTGGAETFLMKLYRSIDTNKYRFDFVVNDEGVYDKEVNELGGVIYKIPLRTQHPIQAFLQLYKIVKDNNYSYVLKLCDTPIGVIDLAAARLGGAKKIGVRSCNAGTSNMTVSKRVLFSIIRPVFNYLSDYKIAPSKLAAEFTFGKLACHIFRIDILHNGLNLDEYCFNGEDRIKVRQELGLSDSIVIGHVGRFNSQKNHSKLLLVFHEILKMNPRSKLLLVGTGELEKDIKTRVKQLGMEDNVIFTGIRLDIPAILSAMDVFVFPSFYEGLPNTVIEAQASGLPCLVSSTITNEVKLTSLVRFLDLNESDYEWAKCAVNCINDHRVGYNKLLQDSGFSIDSVSKDFINLVF